MVGKAFDGIANMNGLDIQGILKRMKIECSPLCIYFHCDRHVLNLALQDFMTQIEPLRNVLDSVQLLRRGAHMTRLVW